MYPFPRKPQTIHGTLAEILDNDIAFGKKFLKILVSPPASKSMIHAALIAVEHGEYALSASGNVTQLVACALSAAQL